MSDAESRGGYLDRILLEHDEGDLWVFGYGSLMWKPEMDFAESRPALLNGWHRRFCLWQWRYRGSRRNPGLMLALDRGGACRGIAYRLAAPDVRGKVTAVWKREMTGNGYRPRWVKLDDHAGPGARPGLRRQHATANAMPVASPTRSSPTTSPGPAARPAPARNTCWKPC